MSSRLRSPSFWNALALVSIFSVVGHAACDSGVEPTGSTTTAVATNGTGYHPACNNGVRDGFCNAHGAVPESCDCLDCTDTAICKAKCTDDGTCNPGAGEDCTCTDCFGQSIDGMDCQMSSDQGQGPAPSSGPVTVAASTTAAGPTTAAATTADTTAAAGTGGAGGGGG